MSSMYDTTTELGRRQQAIVEKIYKYTSEYQSLVMMMYIPFYALIAKLIFRRYKKYNYTELLVIFLYAQAHLSIATALIIPLVGLLNVMSLASVSVIIFPLQIVYFIFTLKRVFGLTRRQIFFRTLVFLFWMLLLFIILSIATGVAMYQSGMFDK